MHIWELYPVKILASYRLKRTLYVLHIVLLGIRSGLCLQSIMTDEHWKVFCINNKGNAKNSGTCKNLDEILIYLILNCLIIFALLPETS